MFMHLSHYLACRKSCCCQGCKEGLWVALWLAFFSSLQKKSRAVGSWAYRMEMKAY